MGISLPVTFRESDHFFLVLKSIPGFPFYRITLLIHGQKQDGVLTSLSAWLGEGRA